MQRIKMYSGTWLLYNKNEIITFFLCRDASLTFFNQLFSIYILCSTWHVYVIIINVCQRIFLEDYEGFEKNVRI